jgi:predicted type IV restriction endonuclease
MTLDLRSAVDPMVHLDALILQTTNRDSNEAETRKNIIDFVLYDLLTWPKNRVAVEEYIHPGYADYILKKANGDDLLFIEAKKEGVYFELPIPNQASETSAYISIKKLITDDNIKNAITQVRNYCQDTGCEYAAVPLSLDYHVSSPGWESNKAIPTG